MNAIINNMRKGQEGGSDFSPSISEITNFVEESIAVSYNKIKKKFNVNDKALDSIKKKLSNSQKVLLMKNKLVWAYSSPKLENSLLKKRL